MIEKLIKTLVGIIIVFCIIYLIYLFGKVGQALFKVKEWINGFTKIFIVLAIAFIIIWISYFIGDLLLGGLG